MSLDDVFGMLIALVTAGIVIWLSSKMEEQSAKIRGEPLAQEPCPPHQWRHHEQPGGGWYLKCNKCKIFPSVSARDDF